MINTAEVRMWGRTIGYLYLKENSPYASFEYDTYFQSSQIELSPLKMPLSNRIYEFPMLADSAFHGVPGMIADSLPDKFGNAVINRWLASRGIPESDFNVIDRLCYTGERGMGALEYAPANGPSMDASESVNIDEMVNFASDILNRRKDINLNWENNLTYSQLLKLGTSAGGARAKAIIAWNPKTGEVRSGQIKTNSDFDYWIIKFDGVSKNGDHGLEDAPQYTRIEYAYYKMAVAAGIHMNPCRLLDENGRSHFMTKRFDRVDGKKIHMQTLGALAHIDYNMPGICGYEQAAAYMKEMQLPKADIEQLYRRMVFNVLGVNQDDHVKNISFLMNRQGVWRLSPAYDITFSYNETNRWLSAHQMLVNGKKSLISVNDLLESGKQMNISSRKCNAIIEEVHASLNKWEEIASETGIKDKSVEVIQEKIRESFIL